MKHTRCKTTDQHRTTDTRRLNRETNEGNEGDTGGATETMIRQQDGRRQTIDMGAHATNNKQQAMCSTQRDIWWPARAHQQDRDNGTDQLNYPNSILTQCQDFLALHPLTEEDLLATFRTVLYGTARD